MLEFVDAELKSAIKEFYTITGIPFAIGDDTKKFFGDYSLEPCSFCRELRRSEELNRRCIECDKIGFAGCERTHKPYVYECHMGFNEAVIPIIEDDKIIGYIIMGRFLKSGNESRVRMAMLSAAQTYGLDIEKLEAGLAEIKSVSPEFIESCASVMSMFVSYLHTNKILMRCEEDISQQLEKYVENHFCEPLSVTELCRRMYISKSKLYQLSVERFGMGISDYIRARRIKEAKRLLDTTDKAISSISECVGFTDANYFTRSFKKSEGMTPKEYRAKSR